GTRPAAGAGSSAAARPRPRRRAGTRRGCASGGSSPDLRGSGSWRSTHPETRRGAGCKRPRCAAGRRVWMSAPPCSLGEVGQPVLADLELVPVLEPSRFDPAPVQERPVQAAAVLDEEPALAANDDRVAARDSDVVEEHVAVRRPPDRRLLILEQEMLPRAPSA